MTQNSQVPQAAPVSAKPLFSITANSHRELLLRVAQAILQKGQETGQKFIVLNNKGDKEKKYAIWDMDDSGRIGQYNAGITLTPEESRMFPMTDGCPIVFSGGFVLRQLTPVTSLASKISERQAATAERVGKNLGAASEDALLAALNAARLARGEKPIEG